MPDLRFYDGREQTYIKHYFPEQATGQGILLRPDQVYGSRKMAELRERYRKRAFEWVERVLRRDGHVEYDVLWRGALSFPLVWERDLKTWLKERESKGDLKVPLRSGQRAVKRARGNVVDWVKG